MNAWLDQTQSANILSLGVLRPDPNNPIYSPILEIKREFLLDSPHGAADGKQTDPQKVLVAAIVTNDIVALQAVHQSHLEVAQTLYPSQENGFSMLLIAVVLGQYDILEALLAFQETDCNSIDTALPNYTPLMWAVSVADLKMTALMLQHGADPHLCARENGPSAVTMVEPESSEIYNYFRSHNLIDTTHSPRASGTYETNTFTAEQNDYEDDISYKIRMQSLGATSDSDGLEDMPEANEEALLAMDSYLVELPDFDYKNPLPDQFIKFTESDIPSLLDYIFNLRTLKSANQRDCKTPAAIIFQLIHYSHNKANSSDLTEFLFDCFTSRLRSVTNTKSGVFNMALTNGDIGQKSNAAHGAGDIVLLSYWLSVSQFLHYYLTRGNFYSRYPKFLQELINITQSLIATLSFSINSRLNLLVDDCLLNFTSLVDVNSVLYAKDWNLFKSNKKHPSSYEDIMQMLYPPSLTELMKPSPLRYIQVLGALDYVLKVHSVDSLLRFQTFSQVFYHINCVVFNRLISNSKFCSRVKAIQIRLNISALEDWLRSHNYRPHKPESIGGLSKLLGGTADVQLTSLLDENGKSDDPNSLSFYYRPLYSIGKLQLNPTIELLQYLQIMSGFNDEKSFLNIIKEFNTLNYYQLVKASRLYRYEVGESRVPKNLVQLLKRLMLEQGTLQIERLNMHYMTQTTLLLKELYIYLNPNFIFGVSLPNSQELIETYGAGLGGLRKLRLKKFQPSLTISVMDDIDELIAQNRNGNINESYDYEEDENSAKEVDSNEDEESGVSGLVKENTKVYKQMQPPSILAHKNWGVDDIDANPW